MSNKEKSMQITGRLNYSNSGSRVEFIQCEDHIAVRKHYDNALVCTEEAFHHGRIRNIMEDVALSKYFHIPEMLVCSPRYSYYEMEYIHGIPVIECLSWWSKEQIDYFIKAVLYWFEYFLRRSKASTYIEVFDKKLIGLVDYLPPHVYWYMQWLTHRKKVTPANNICHGDFTMSNILWMEDENLFALVDPHLCFHQSIMQDYVKFRQDTYYCWSLDQMQTIKTTVDPVKIRSVLRYIDSRVTPYLFGMYVPIMDHYQYFQAFNIARLLPYCNKQKQKTVLKWLKQILSSRRIH